MAWKTQISGYVKFLRGTPALWAEITEKDNDTIYFISEPSASTGKLYLGDKLISGGGEGGTISLNDLEDVLISAGITAPSLLVYDTVTSKWKPQTVASIISQYISTMTGATENSDGTGGLVPQPIQNQQNLFLRGDATWANPVLNIENELNTLIGNDTGKSAREIASEEVAGLIANAPAAFDTLKEIADWIDTHDATADIVNLNNVVFGTENTDGLANLVPVIQEDVNGLNNRMTVVETAVSEIDDRLRWQNIIENN